MVEGILSRLLDPQRSVSLDFLTPEEILPGGMSA